jgi:hypothetical protein
LPFEFNLQRYIKAKLDQPGDNEGDEFDYDTFPFQGDEFSYALGARG